MTAVAQRARAKAQPEYMIVQNLHHSHVSLKHPETGQEVTVPPYTSVALRDPDDWDNVPDLERLVQKGLLSTSRSTRRPPQRPILPLPYSSMDKVARATAYEIAYYPPDKEEMAVQLIQVVPELLTPNLGSENPNVDVVWLKTTHRMILQAATWLIENTPLLPDWKHDRLRLIRERLEFIANMRA